MVDVFVGLSVLDVATGVVDDVPDTDWNGEDDLDVSEGVGAMVVVDCDVEVELEGEVDVPVVEVLVAPVLVEDVT